MSLWNRFGFGTTKPLGMGKKAKTNSFRPELDQLENRVVPAGNLIVFFVDGLGGYELKNPGIGEAHGSHDAARLLKFVNEIIPGDNNSLKAQPIVYTTDWNSSDPTRHSSNAGIFEVTGLGFEGIKTDIIPDYKNLRFDYGNGLEGPQPFINKLSAWLDNNTKPEDTVILIGHSLGGAAILKVANQTSAQIDFLFTIDPVGFNTNAIQVKWGPIFSVTNSKIPGCDEIPGIGWPGSRAGLEVPGSNTRYFMNRYQQSYFFPLDFNNNGDLLAGTKIGKFGVEENRDASIRQNEDGKPINHTGNLIDLAFGYSTPVLFGSNTKVNKNGHAFYAETSFGGDTQSITTDPLIFEEFKKVMKGVIPQLPVINAGPDKFNINEGNKVYINGATATDANLDDTLTYKWECISKPFGISYNDVKIENGTTLFPTFTIPDDGEFVFLLTVSDGSDIVYDTVNVYGKNTPPIINYIRSVTVVVSQFEADFLVKVYDKGIRDNVTLDIDYGDGSLLVRDYPSGGSRPQHTYLNPGSYVIHVTAKDKDGGFVHAFQNIEVKSFGIINGDLLAVGGTSKDDSIQADSQDGKLYTGTVNGEVIGPIRVPSTGAIAIRTGTGNDNVKLGIGKGKISTSTKVNVDMGLGKDMFSSFSNTAGASARVYDKGLSQYSYFGGGDAFIAVLNAETTSIEPNGNDSYVAALYHKLLERNPSKPEVKIWSKQFSLEKYEYIAHNIFYSAERSGITVNKWYTTYLGRTPTAAEAKPWISLLAAGKNEELTLAKFLANKEYIVKQGGGSGYIQSLYSQFLGRNASQATVNSLLKDHGNPPNYYNVAVAILTSKEYQMREITQYYDRFLDRNQAAVTGFADPNAFSRNGVGPKEVSDWLFARVSPHAARYQMSWHPEFVNNGL